MKTPVYKPEKLAKLIFYFPLKEHLLFLQQMLFF